MKQGSKILGFFRTNAKRSALDRKNPSGSNAFSFSAAKRITVHYVSVVGLCVAKCLSLFSRHERSGSVARRGEKEIVTLKAFYESLNFSYIYKRNGRLMPPALGLIIGLRQ